MLEQPGYAADRFDSPKKEVHPLNTPKTTAVVEAEAAAAKKDAASKKDVRSPPPEMPDVSRWILPTREAFEINIPSASNEKNEAGGGFLGVFSLAYSDEGRYLAAAGADGIVRIYDNHGRRQWIMNTSVTTKAGGTGFESGGWPCSACCWRPKLCSVTTPSVLVTGSVSGDIIHWHAPSQKQIYKMTEKDNQIYTISYRKDGERFITAGKDYTIRVYDEETKACIHKMEKGILGNTGHSNRIFASKWKPDDPNMLLTGGWDNNIMIWDMRTQQVARSIYGPHLAGEAIDIQNETVLTGSWRQKDALETWDFGTGKKLQTISNGVSMVYTAKFLVDREGYCVAGGTGLNELRVFNLNDMTQKSSALTIGDPMRAGIYTCAVKDNHVAVAGSCNQIRVFTF